MQKVYQNSFFKSKNTTVATFLNVNCGIKLKKIEISLLPMSCKFSVSYTDGLELLILFEHRICVRKSDVVLMAEL
jgi:hypothetical protein